MVKNFQTKQDIVELIRKNHSQIKALGVKRLGLFGSFIHGEQRADSDVDMLGALWSWSRLNRSVLT